MAYIQKFFTMLMAYIVMIHMFVNE